MYIVTTRFNTQTWRENKNYKNNLNKNDLNKNKQIKCIYGSPIRIRDNITPKISLFVLEMHNDQNKIKGIGYIKNVVYKTERIYSDRNYNRYIYKGYRYISRDKLNKSEKKIIRVLDILIFKGQRHIKRGQGFSILPDWITENKHISFINFIKQVFIDHNEL